MDSITHAGFIRHLHDCYGMAEHKNLCQCNDADFERFPGLGFNQIILHDVNYT